MEIFRFGWLVFVAVARQGRCCALDRVEGAGRIRSHWSTRKSVSIHENDYLSTYLPKLFRTKSKDFLLGCHATTLNKITRV